jgi:hypothetical protein
MGSLLGGLVLYGGWYTRSLLVGEVRYESACDRYMYPVVGVAMNIIRTQIGSSVYKVRFWCFITKSFVPFGRIREGTVHCRCVRYEARPW